MAGHYYGGSCIFIFQGLGSIIHIIRQRFVVIIEALMDAAFAAALFVVVFFNDVDVLDEILPVRAASEHANNRI